MSHRTLIGLLLVACLTGCGKSVPPSPTPQPVEATEPEVAPAPRLVAVGLKEPTKRELASLRCEFFEKQCKAFYAKYGRAPTGLVELVAPDPAVAKPLISGGADNLIDPWGKGQYQLDVQPDAIFVVYCYDDGDPEKPIYSSSRSKLKK